ncbi:hypothetical protein GLOIN_2v1781695 [Rhizophagus irregularis DAOM 181602=DAOM 197198]|nr:hypothetical protein GLOIN_2v1781695 [Rhizophagus irregularis DAOM 181602=DAOM 197198]
MACSKVLLGNFPELTDDIIHYFRGDIPTLHSCVLVNKFWCQIAIPLLWEDPCGINNNVFPSKTLFNYSNFIKCINTRDICSSIVNWIEANKTFTCSKGHNSIPLYNIISDSNSSKPLKIIIFHRIDFRNILHIKKAFEQLNKILDLIQM